MGTIYPTSPNNSTTKSLGLDAGPLPWADEQAKPLTAEQIARATDAINFVLVAAGTPDTHRAYLDALIGASLGATDWFEAADIEVGQRARQVSTIGLKDKTIEKWVQREREEFSEWQTAREITLIEAMPGGKQDGINHKSKYRLASLFRLAIETDRRARLKPGFERNPKRELRKAAEAVYAEFRAGRQEPAKRNRFRKARRSCDTYLKLINTYLEQLCGQALLERRDLPMLLDGISLIIQKKRELLINSLAPTKNRTQVQQTQEDNPGEWVDNIVHSKNGADSGFVHTDFNKSMDKKTGPPIGQSMEDFLTENFPDELDVGEAVENLSPSGDEISTGGPTQKMRDLILRAGRIVPASFSEASALIAELIAAGAFSTFLSLEELRGYDAGGGRGPGANQRWCCPPCGKTITDAHRDLSVDIHTGEYFCHACHTRGVLREYLGVSSSPRPFIHPAPQPPEPKSDKWREWWDRAEPVAGMPGARYLEGRGVPIEIATAAGVRYGQWWKRGANGPERFNAVLFPMFDADGNLVAVIARATVGKIMRTGGDKSLGVFCASPDVLKAERIAICEAPIDALILAAIGLNAIAIGGTSWAEWLPGVLAGKDVALAFDADELDKHGRRAGDDCAAALGSLLSGRATVWRLRPQGYKDWSEIAEWDGLDGVYNCAITAMERAPELEVVQ